MRIVCMRNYLWDFVAFQLHFFAGKVKQAEGNYVADSLDLMDDGISERQTHTIFHGQLP